MRTLKLFFVVFTIFQLATSCKNKSNASDNRFARVYNPIVQIKHLSDTVNETSGLIFYRNFIWTFNDSGGEPSIYRLDTVHGNIIQEIRLSNVHNVDFEDITQDEDFIFLGDIGNNFGNRKDLCIYKIAKKDIPLDENATVKAEEIHYNYADQHNFIIRPRMNNFDCEALISMKDQLYLFTKNWDDGKTRVYKLLKEAGNYSLDVVSEFPADGLITGGDYDAKTGTLGLVGYKDFMPFVWIFWDFDDDNFFDGKKVRLNLEEIHGAQTEGICFNPQGDFLISCEESYYPQTLYRIPASDLKISADSIIATNHQNKINITSSYAKDQECIELKINGLEQGDYTVEICNDFWQLEEKFSFQARKEGEESQILDATNLESGMYYLRVEQNGKPMANRIYINR